MPIEGWACGETEKARRRTGLFVWNKSKSNSFCIRYRSEVLRKAPSILAYGRRSEFFPLRKQLGIFDALYGHF
jgi:hypothetical protein